MSAEENKAAVRRGIEKVWNENNWAAAVDSYAEDVVVHFGPMPDPIVGRDAFGELHEMVHVGFPDYSVTIDDIVAEEDRVAARWTLRATHTGEFIGIPATGRSVVVEEFSHFRFENGKAKEVWLMPNFMTQLQQMGVMPEGPPPKAMVKMMQLVGKIQGLRRRKDRT
jgi:steroid delta-isomerase-like uncharacterized protein